MPCRCWGRARASWPLSPRPRPAPHQLCSSHTSAHLRQPAVHARLAQLAGEPAVRHVKCPRHPSAVGNLQQNAGRVVAQHAQHGHLLGRQGAAQQGGGRVGWACAAAAARSRRPPSRAPQRCPSHAAPHLGVGGVAVQAGQRALAVERDGALKRLLLGQCPVPAGSLALLLAPVAAALVGGGQRAVGAAAGGVALGPLDLLPLALACRQQRQLALGEGAAALESLLACGLQEGLRRAREEVKEKEDGAIERRQRERLGRCGKEDTQGRRRQGRPPAGSRAAPACPGAGRSPALR